MCFRFGVCLQSCIFTLIVRLANLTLLTVILQYQLSGLWSVGQAKLFAPETLPVEF